MYLCYRWTCIVNGKQYIGITKKSILGRWGEHCRAANRNSKQVFHKAIRKYGKDNFIGEVLIICEDEQNVLLNEQKFIKEYNTTTDGNGYNLTSGGEYPKVTEAVKKYQSLRAKQRAPITEETRKKLSESHKGLPSGKKGKSLSDEMKKRISNTLKGKRQSDKAIAKRSGTNHFNAKLVSINGITYGTIREAAKKLNIAESTLYNRAKSKRFPTCILINQGNQ